MSNFPGFFTDKFAEKSANFAGNFRENFAKKQSVKNDRFCGYFQGKFRWKSIGFALIRPLLTEVIVCSFNNNTLKK